MRKFLTLFSVLVLYSLLANSQTKNITGQVTDQKGQPVSFATIRIKGSKVGVSADADGNFSIKAKEGNTLIITGTGITSKEVIVSAGTVLNIQVAFQPSNLTEVVVTALGVRREAKTLGFSTAKIDAKDINSSAPINVADGVTGKV